MNNLTTAIAVLAHAAAASNAATTFNDRAAFQAATGTLTVLTFANLGPNGSNIPANAYASLGVTLDGNDVVTQSSAFTEDFFGADANGNFTFTFDQPQIAIGFDFPGQLDINLFLGSTPVATGITFGGVGTGLFGGITDVTFDSAVVTDQADGAAFIDTVYFTAIPAPAATALLATAALATTRRRR